MKKLKQAKVGETVKVSNRIIIAGMVIGVVINMGSLMYGGDVRGYIYGGQGSGCRAVLSVYRSAGKRLCIVGLRGTSHHGVSCGER